VGEEERERYKAKRVRGRKEVRRRGSPWER
jgi:hypothetical protein